MQLFIFKTGSENCEGVAEHSMRVPKSMEFPELFGCFGRQTCADNPTATLWFLILQLQAIQQHCVTGFG